MDCFQIMRSVTVLTVNRVSLEPSSNIALPLFSEAHRLLEMDIDLEVQDDDDNEDEGEEQRDLLAEMELTARLMITGGEAKEDEKMSRADRSAIRQAIFISCRENFTRDPTSSSFNRGCKSRT